MNTISFVVDNERFGLLSKNIPKGSLLHKMITTSVNVNKDKDGSYILNCDKEEFMLIYSYLHNGKIPAYDELEAFDYFGIDLSHSYELSLLIEDDMRNNMYKDEYKELYFDKYYGLIKANEYFWNNFETNKCTDQNLLFNTKSIIKSGWSIIQDKLKQFKKFTDIKGVFVAGGSIFSILFGLPINDIDLFLHGVTEDETLEIINQISQLLIKRDVNDNVYKDKLNKVLDLLNNVVFDEAINNINYVYYDIDNKKEINKFTDLFGTWLKSTNDKLLSGLFSVGDFKFFRFNIFYYLDKFYNQECSKQISILLDELFVEPTQCTRTANAITFKNRNTEIQIVLRLYQTPSEILHGFDVDSCCIGFDGNDIWMTHRACFAVKNGYNTVNFNRLSPSYELRLAKYGCRGVAIKIPNFDINNVDYNTLLEYFDNNKAEYNTAFYKNHNHLSALYNIDKLLYLNYYCEHYNYKTHSVRMISKLNHEKSDYASYPFVYYVKGANGSGISDLMGYFYDVYVDLLEFDERIETDGPVDISDEYVSNEHEGIHEELKTTSTFLKSEVNNALKLLTNSIHNKFWFIKGELKYLNQIINIPDLIYDALALGQPWDFPAKLKFKITNPGEQMTNTFHQIILEDNSQWYKGKFYKF